KNIHCAVMTVGGWFDAEDLFGALNTYKAIEAQNPGIKSTLVMGPWWHGGWASGQGDRIAEIDFGSKTSATYQENMEFPFFNYYLKDKGTEDLPEARIFVTGANEWKSFSSWPPPGVQSKSLYLQEGRSLSFTTPSGARREYDEYVSDPAAPVPYSNVVSTHRDVTYMIEDQRFAARRPDVLWYQTSLLT